MDLALGEFDKNMKACKLLDMLSKSLGQKNYELFLKHEKMLEANRKERKELGESFQKTMEDVNKEAEAIRAERERIV